MGSQGPAQPSPFLFVYTERFRKERQNMSIFMPLGWREEFTVNTISTSLSCKQWTQRTIKCAIGLKSRRSKSHVIIPITRSLLMPSWKSYDMCYRNREYVLSGSEVTFESKRREVELDIEELKNGYRNYFSRYLRARMRTSSLVRGNDGEDFSWATP